MGDASSSISLLLEGMAEAISPHVSTVSSKLALRTGFFYPFDRVILVGVPSMGDSRNSHSISVQDKIVTPKINVQDSAPISHPQGYELAISRLKTGWAEVIVASHIF